MVIRKMNKPVLTKGSDALEVKKKFIEM